MKWNKCNHKDIAEALKAIELLYDADLINTNVYFRLKKGETSFSLYDMSTFEEATVNISKNMILEKKFENIACISNENIEIIKMVMSYIENWNDTNKKIISDFLISKLAVLTSAQKQIINISNIEKIEEVVVLLFSSIGINPAEILMPDETHLGNERESIESKLNSETDSCH